MDRAKEIELLAQCLELTRDKRPFVADGEGLIPVADYLDPTMYEQERDQLLRRSMNIVAHSSQLPDSGDFITRDLLGTPILIVRQRDGSARAFLNVCRHRGATVESRDSGSCKRFTCPYHAWTYETDGSLAAVRHAEGFPSLDIDNTRLAELSAFEAAGLVWVCPDPAVTDGRPDEATRALSAELERFNSPDSVVFAKDSKIWNANWKLIADGGLESYHFRILHRDTIASFFTDNISTFELLGDHIRTILPRRSIVELAEQPQSEWDIREHTHIVYFVAPNATILVQEHHFELILTTPLSIDQTRVDLMTVVPKPGAQGFGEKAQSFWELNHDFTKKTLYEDFAIAEKIQEGMHTGANEFFRFATFEGALTQWHRRLDARLGRSSRDRR